MNLPLLAVLGLTAWAVVTFLGVRPWLVAALAVAALVLVHA
ncbi:hypothetical protein [Streptomyces phytohabitans]